MKQPTPPIPLPTAAPETGAIKAVEVVIAAHPFLKGLSPAHLRVLADNAMRMSYAPNDYIFREGDQANRFYLIERGQVVLEASAQYENPVPIQTLGPGDVLGWSWLYPPYRWHFDARTAEPTTAIFFYGTRLREQCEEDHSLGYELMKRMSNVLIQRLQATRKQLLEARH